MSLIRMALTGRMSAKTEARSWQGGISMGRSTKSGEQVSASSAMGLSTYFACMRNIAEDTAKLPLRLYERMERGNKPVFDHPVARLLRSPNPECTAMTVRETLMAWAVGWGNGYAEILSNGRMEPAQLNPVHPVRVTPKRDANGVMYYEVRNRDGGTKQLDAARVFHVHGLSFDGCVGMSVATYGAESLGIALAAQGFAGTFFGNGTWVSGILSTPKAMTPEQRTNTAKSWNETYGGVDNANKVAVLEQDLKYQPLTMPMKDAQFLESRRFQNEEIARWFRMPLSKVQDSQRAQGWSTLDAMNADYVTDTLLPWLERMEQEAERKLLRPEERDKLYIKHEVKGQLRGDTKTRTDVIDKRVKNGTMTPNEGRAYEDENPSEDPAADRLYMQGAMVPLDRLGQQQASAPAPAPESPVEPTPSEKVGALRPLFERASSRVMRKHEKATTAHFGRKDYLTWLEGFLVEQVDFATEEFAPIFETLGAPIINAERAAANFFRDPIPEEKAETSLAAEMMRAAEVGLSDLDF